MSHQPDLFEAAVGSEEYWKRPIAVKAVQLTSRNYMDVIVWIETNGKMVLATDTPGIVAIETLEGTMLATPGDYVVQGIEGEFYPVRKGIFEATYSNERPASLTEEFGFFNAVGGGQSGFSSLESAREEEARYARMSVDWELTGLDRPKPPEVLGVYRRQVTPWEKVERHDEQDGEMD